MAVVVVVVVVLVVLADLWGTKKDKSTSKAYAIQRIDKQTNRPTERKREKEKKRQVTVLVDSEPSIEDHQQCASCTTTAVG